MAFANSLRRVIWFEGMNLDPRHFQQADRFHQTALNFRLQTLNVHGWGLIELKINQEALTNGQFSLVGCKGIMPDGLIIDLPDSDRLPSARALSDQFPATAEKLDVFLAIRAERTMGGNTLLEQNTNISDSRFEWDDSVEIADDNDIGRLLPVGTAHANFKIKLGGEPLDDYSVIKIAEVLRKAGSGYILSNAFIPTSLFLSASENLMSEIRDLLSELARRSSGQKGQYSFGKAEFNSAETGSFWLAQCLNRHIPVLNHYYQLGRSHPEQLYLSLLTLAGELTAFPSKGTLTLSDLSQYRHEELQCMLTLKRQILQLLDGIQPKTPFEILALEHIDEVQWRSRMLEPTMLRPSRIYMCIKSSIPEEKLKLDIPKLAKIGAPGNITHLITYNLPGLSLSYVAHPPVGLPTGAGEQYFRLEKAGEVWDGVLKENSIALFIPKDIELTDLKVLVLQD